MSGDSSVSPPADVDLARECLYRFLSVVVAGPYSADWDRALDGETHDLVITAWRWLQPESDQLEITRLTDELKASPQALRSQYDRVFGLVSPKECPPYETEYYPAQETFGRSQQLADVAGFYKAFGIEPARSTPDRPDHLAFELEFMGFLLLKKRLVLPSANAGTEAGEHANVCELALRDFLRDHLAWWLPGFAAGLLRKAHGGYLEALAWILAAWIRAECGRLKISSVLRPVQPESIEAPEEQSGCASCLLHA
jgi:TorA maturation chaperone TorD